MSLGKCKCVLVSFSVPHLLPQPEGRNESLAFTKTFFSQPRVPQVFVFHVAGW